MKVIDLANEQDSDWIKMIIDTKTGKTSRQRELELHEELSKRNLPLGEGVKQASFQLGVG